jgi:hypothetical protein
MSAENGKRSLHERVASVMMSCEGIAAFNTYEGVLSALKTGLPTEEDLKAQIKVVEDRMKANGLAPEDYKFLEEVEKREGL